MKYENIPTELKQLNQWVCWRTIQDKKGKNKKVPFQPNGKTSSSTDPKTWSSFETVKNTNGFDGIGFVFTETDPYVGIDMDNCINNGKIEKEVELWVKRFNSYTEISQSGGGIHVIVRGKLPTTGGRSKDKRVEIYQQGRYFIFTGETNDEIKPIKNRQVEIDGFLNEFFPTKTQPKQTYAPTNANDFDRVIQAVDLVEFIENETGQRVNEKNRITPCPFCGKDDRFSVDPEKKLFHCFGADCGKSGNVIHFVMEFHRYSKGQALRYISQKEGIPLSERKTPTKTERNIETKSSFDPSVEADIFKEGRYLIFHNEQLKQYKDGCYRSFSDRYFLNLLTRQIKIYKSRQFKAREILECLKNSLADPKLLEKINSDPYIINCKNGLLDIRTMNLSPHSPDFISTYQVNSNYNQKAKIKRFKAFLNEIFIDDLGNTDNDLIKIIQEFMGYCLFLLIPFGIALIFYGGGSNGKRVLTQIIAYLLRGHVSNVHFEEIGIDRFATADISESLLNVSSEISANACLKDDKIKNLIAPDNKIRAQRKHQPSFDFEPVAKHIITANTLPRSADKSFAFFRRFLIIPFNQTFLPEKEIENQLDELKKNFLIEDPNLIEKLKNELDGILLFSLNGLKRLLKNKTFTGSEQVQNLNKIFKIRSTSVETFIDELTEFSSEGSIILPEVFKTYVDFCKGYKIPALTKNKFANELRNQGFVVEKGTASKTFVRGISWKIESY